MATKAIRRMSKRSAPVLRFLTPPAALLLLALTGCVGLPWQKKTDAPAPPVDSMVLGGGGLERYRGILDSATQTEMDSAHRSFVNREFGKAEAQFGVVLKKKNLPVNAAEEALYYQGECQYQQRHLRDAQATFNKHLRTYRNGQHAQMAIQRLFEIGDFWLEGTRAEMKSKADGSKTFMVIPATMTVNFGRDKPFLDTEGHAMQALEEVRLNDIGGPYGEQASFYLATVKFFREKFKDADYYFTQLYQNYPNSKLAPKAIKQSIICKHMCTDGTCYDCRVVEENRKLLDIATVAYPQLVAKENDWLERQLKAVNLQQADRDFKVADFYSRTGHPGSAYFYYELVRRCYPNTTYAEKAAARMAELRTRIEIERGPGAIRDERSPAPGSTLAAPMRLPEGVESGPAVPER